MSASHPDLANLPGADLVLRGLDDLAYARPTPEAALVEIARTRLGALGLAVQPDPSPSPSPASDAELRLYDRLAQRHPGRDPHLLYGAWLDQLVSFLASLTERRERLVSAPRAGRATREAQ
ncbi:MAG: hypothetical protein DCC71_05090 [Proteobacteria bacterium]|nr:MAG: hypothetical protein DCC71_05090 [Pseudomonadota bacterium]